ncbi:nuclear factor 7, brain-like [Eucyclogobius newberryi]|uniref:nuclear factor 7, brain-like n=1 Tax=Eucyclogobius newberryi TaxID=166745 RepID=UPI003B5B6A15
MSSVSEENLICPICLDIFHEPVLLLCSHSFCKDCLTKWRTEKSARECPVCKKQTSQTHPPRNLALKILCEAHLQKQPNAVTCSLHSERVQLYCLEDQEPVCVVCRDSSAHKDHRFRPVNEAAIENREVLTTCLLPLKEKLNILLEFNISCVQTVDHIKQQARDTQKQICNEFLKLHKILMEEEEARMKALMEEEEQKTQRMKDKMAAVSKEIEGLSETIRATEEQLRATDVSFLLKYKAAVERVLHCPLQEEPQLGTGALIDQAKHLHNLAFNSWSNMKTLVEYRPFVLDPNTANPALLLSDDLTNVRDASKKSLPDNPERFDRLLFVLGSEGFESGTHSWVVEVGDNSNWLLGVVSESFQRKICKGSDSGLWRVSLRGGEYIAFSVPNNVIKLSPKNKPTKIRLTLDFKKWKLSVCDANTDAHIHTFTYNFNGKIYPLFNTIDTLPLAIEPQAPPDSNNRLWWWF